MMERTLFFTESRTVKTVFHEETNSPKWRSNRGNTGVLHFNMGEGKLTYLQHGNGRQERKRRSEY